MVLCGAPKRRHQHSCMAVVSSGLSSYDIFSHHISTVLRDLLENTKPWCHLDAECCFDHKYTGDWMECGNISSAEYDSGQLLPEPVYLDAFLWNRITDVPGSAESNTKF